MRGASSSSASSLWKREGVKIEVSDEDAATLKAGTVDFYSFSYYMSATAFADPKASEGGNTGGTATRTSRRATGARQSTEGLKYYMEEVYDRYRSRS